MKAIIIIDDFDPQAIDALLLIPEQLRQLQDDQGIIREQLLAAIRQSAKETRRLMNAETTAVLARIDAVSTDLAGDLQRLIDLAAAQGSLSEAEVRAALEPRVTFLEGLAHVSDDPIPPAPDPIPEPPVATT
jgi:hypothetical protein